MSKSYRVLQPLFVSYGLHTFQFAFTTCLSLIHCCRSILHVVHPTVQLVAIAAVCVPGPTHTRAAATQPIASPMASSRACKLPNVEDFCTKTMPDGQTQVNNAPCSRLLFPLLHCAYLHTDKHFPTTSLLCRSTLTMYASHVCSADPSQHGRG